ncbi:MAG: LysE family translocator [Ferruginibacter sp.]
MTGIQHFETFFVAAILLNLTPGNDTIFILSKSMAQGKKAGILSVLGIATGSIIHTLVAASGLSLLIAQSVLIFSIIKYAGALYLIYSGIKIFTGKAIFYVNNAAGEQLNCTKIYGDAVITNVLNPKVALFFISFLPQFIDPSIKNALFPFLLLGFTFTCTGTAWCMLLAIFSAAISGKLKNSKTFTLINKISGAALIGLGIKLAFSSRE